MLECESSNLNKEYAIYKSGKSMKIVWSTWWCISPTSFQWYLVCKILRTQKL